MPNADADARVKTAVEVTEPPLFRVIYLNDEQTSMEFVIDSLVTHFAYNEETAKDITIDIHANGSAVVAVLPFEAAEQKGVEVTLAARSLNYPLQIKLEAEEN